MTTALTVFGGLLMVLGAWQGYETLFMPIDVAGTVNLAMVQSQTIAFGISATLFLAGSVFVAAGCLYYALSRQRSG